MFKQIFSLLIVAAAMLLATPGVEAGVYVDLIDTAGAEYFDIIPTGTAVTFKIMMDNDAGDNVIGIANGIRIYTLNGATWQTPALQLAIVWRPISISCLL